MNKRTMKEVISILSLTAKRRLVVLILSIAMLVTFPINMNWFVGGIEAYAETNEIDLSSSTKNGFVSDISFAYNVNSAGHGDEIILPDSSQILTAKVSLTSQKILDDGALYLSIYVNGTLVRSNGQKQKRIMKAGTTAHGLNHRDYPAGEVKNLSIVVGRIDADKNYTDYDVYNYKVSRALTLKSLQIKKEGGEVLPISPAYNAKALPMEKEYSTVYDGNNVYLDLAATTAAAQIYVGNSPYNAQTAISLSEYTEEGSDIAKIPVSVQCKDAKTEYTLYISKVDYTPVITEQPHQDKPVDKDSPQPLTIEVETPEKGKLSYQWYKVGSSGATRIQDATTDTYQPPITYAGTQKYKCIVTNTVNDVEFQSSSNTVSYTVNLSEPTAPEFVLQPRQNPNSNNGSRIFYKNGTPEIEVGPIHGDFDYIEGLEYNVQLYRNSIDSTEGGTLIECNSSAGEFSAIMGKTYKKYTFQVPPQDVTGTWYYYATVTVEKDGRSDVSVSQTLPLTFKSTADVVKGLEGDGSESSPFLLHNSDDLLYVKNLVEGKNGAAYNFAGQTLAFADNISLPHDWEPIGNLKAGTESESSGVNIQPFSGIIDGKGYTLTMGDHGKPLLNYVRKATVKNLNLAGTHIDGYGLVDCYTVDYGENGVYVNDPVKLRSIDIENVTIKSGTNILKSGFIGGFASGANAVNIRNCTIEKGVTIGYGKDQDHIGSFAGEFNGNIENCVSYADVYGNNTVGGLIGNKGQSMGPCNIVNSSFQGTVTASGIRSGGIAGAGYIVGSAPGTPMVQVHNCFAVGTITGKDEVGGIIGSERGHYNNVDEGDVYGVKGTISVSDTFFYGTLNCEGSNVGGTVGYFHDFTKKVGTATNYYLEGCGAASGIGGVVEGTIIGADKYSEAATKEAFADGTVLNKLNGSDTSYKNWIKKGDYPVISDEPIITGLKISGEYKNQYIVGEDLNLEGIVIHAIWSKGDPTPVNLSEVTINGYDKNFHGVQKITLRYKAAETTLTVTTLKEDNQDNPKMIKVYFTLLGDKIHDSDTDGKVHTLETGGLETWIARKACSVSVNATVKDVFEKALTEANYTWRNESGNYVQGITKPGIKAELAEFTNGANSGWMYTLNGKHPAFGVAEQYLRNDDIIIFHYTDNYFYEPDTKEWVGSTDEVKNVTTSGAAGAASTTAPTEIKVSGTTATATIKAENQSEILKQAAEKKSAEIILEVSAANTKGADSVQLSLDVTFVKNVADKTDADLTVNTENGKVTLDQETIKTVLAEAKGATITLEVTKVSKPTEAQKKAAGENGHLLKLTIKSGDRVISDFNKGKVKVVAEIVSKLLDKKVAAIHIADDGKIEQLAGRVLTIGGKKYYEFTTPHFSTFALVDADELGLEVKEEPQTDVKALTAKLTPVARSAKTAKKNVKVTTSLDKQDKAIIQELKDAGYAVKYRFYRSTKKAAGYKAAVTKKTSTYTNTSGKKGTKYYYKVQVRVYDANGKLAAKTALKQCRYAARVWSK